MKRIPRKTKKIDISDLGSFEAIYKNLALPVTKFIIKRMSGNTDAAEEVFSRTITAVLEGWNKFENKSTYYTWICRIALNKMADYYREQVNRSSRFVAPFLEDIANIESQELTPDEKLALQELCISVRSCLELLPEEKRKLLYLRYWKDLSVKQIANLLGTSERAAEGKIYRAKKLLGEEINTRHPELGKVYQSRE